MYNIIFLINLGTISQLCCLNDKVGWSNKKKYSHFLILTTMKMFASWALHKRCTPPRTAKISGLKS